MPEDLAPDEVYCTSCGEAVKEEPEICPNCGVRRKGEGGESEDGGLDDIAPYVAWIGGILLILAGLGVFTGGGIASGIVYLLVGIFLLPPVRTAITEDADFEISRGIVVGIGILGIVLGGVLAPASMSSDTTNSPATDPSTSEAPSDSPQDSGMRVEIDYSGSWQGALSTAGNTRSIEGSGSTSYTVTGDPSIVSANAQKQDDSGRRLTVRIIDNGEVVKEQSTTAGYGIAQVSYNTGF